MHFMYSNPNDALSDLKLFSRMNMHEDRVLYAVEDLGHFKVVSETPTDVSRIKAVALNGQMFLPE